MPTSQCRPWSTQYQDSYKKPWQPKQAYRRRSVPNGYKSQSKQYYKKVKQPPLNALDLIHEEARTAVAEYILEYDGGFKENFLPTEAQDLMVTGHRAAFNYRHIDPTIRQTVSRPQTPHPKHLSFSRPSTPHVLESNHANRSTNVHATSEVARQPTPIAPGYDPARPETPQHDPERAHTPGPYISTDPEHEGPSTLDKEDEKEQEEETTKDNPPKETSADKAKEDKENKPHWIEWPEPGEPPKRPHTAVGFVQRAPTDKHFGNRPSSAEPDYELAGNEAAVQGNRITYVPELNCWINTSNEADRDVYNNMLTTLRREQNHEFRGVMSRPAYIRDTYTTYFGPNQAQINVAPTGLYKDSFHPFSGRNGLNRSNTFINSYEQESESKLPNIYGNSLSLKPRIKRRQKFPAISDDYVHEHSMFMTTTPRCTGHFIIHPDWVSERSGLRRSYTTLDRPSTIKSRHGLRYSTF